MGIELGVNAEEIAEAEKLLQTKFPDQLKKIWQVSNGLELPGEWRLFPIFDKKNPKKSWGHIVEENTNGRWEYCPKDLIAIASDGSGDNLVLRTENGNVLETIYRWDHETNKISPSKQKLSDILALAKKRVEKIKKQIEKNVKK